MSAITNLCQSILSEFEGIDYESLQPSEKNILYRIGKYTGWYVDEHGSVKRRALGGLELWERAAIRSAY